MEWMGVCPLRGSSLEIEEAADLSNIKQGMIMEERYMCVWMRLNVHKALEETAGTTKSIGDTSQGKHMWNVPPTEQTPQKNIT